MFVADVPRFLMSSIKDVSGGVTLWRYISPISTLEILHDAHPAGMEGPTEEISIDQLELMVKSAVTVHGLSAFSGKVLAASGRFPAM